MTRRNSYLTPSSERLLRAMLALEGEDELTHATPGGWWLGTNKVSGRTCYALLRLVLIRRESDSRDTYERFTLNEDGRAILADPDYVPRIVGALRRTVIT